MQNPEQIITKIANYLNIKFTYPRREYESPMGKTRYVSRNIEEPLPTQHGLVKHTQIKTRS